MCDILGMTAAWHHLSLPQFHACRARMGQEFTLPPDEEHVQTMFTQTNIAVLHHTQQMQRFCTHSVQALLFTFRPSKLICHCCSENMCLYGDQRKVLCMVTHQHGQIVYMVADGPACSCPSCWGTWRCHCRRCLSQPHSWKFGLFIPLAYSRPAAACETGIYVAA